MRAILLAILVASLASPAEAKWVKIGNGPSLEYAQAYCDNAAMGMPQGGMIAFGSPLYVGMSQFGYGLGAAIRQARYKSNCMVMQGWKQVGSPGSGGNWKNAPRQK